MSAISGIRGRLVSSSFVRDLLPGLDGYERIPSKPARALAAIVTRASATLGPASSRRAVADSVVHPLLRTLGFAVSRRIDEPDRCLLELSPAEPSRSGGGSRTMALVVGYGEPLASTWRDAVRAGAAADARWSLCSNGAALRIIDARRTWSREYLEFDLSALEDSQEAQCALWSLARAEALCSAAPLLDQAVMLSARHGVDVCRVLGRGVLEALQSFLNALGPGRERYAPSVLFEHSLTVLYRVLFLLFAEARSLVPIWHPIYRDRYSLDVIVNSLIEGRPPRGLWKALQAIAHLAHTGCSAGELSVTAFNGRLFAPAGAAAFERGRLDDSVIADALVSVGATSIGKSRRRIAYRDLDVEQLGAVYEQVLDYQPVASGRTVALERSGDARKASGTFYTPRSLTGVLVRQTLDPLVEGRSADAILNLRILDPAMGSGAFLVAACRHLATAAEKALVAEGRWHPRDVSPADRVHLRRQIASRCLFGVDMNPMAVQLARLSLWLAALSADKPLSFLDHHLVAGNSLVGATPDDVRRQPSGGGRGRRAQLSLYDDSSVSSMLAGCAAVRLTLTLEADDSAAVVRSKEQRLADLTSQTGPLGRWARALDLWCAGWFWDRRPGLDPRLSSELLEHVLNRGPRHLADRFAAPLLAHADGIARQQRFLHWPLTFPEVFCNTDGTLLPDAGFDAVVGNPPWDMIRGDAGSADARGKRRTDARCLSVFVRESGVYQVESRAHTNRYQLFVERALQLVRAGGRVGLVLPSGITSDAGSAPLRRFLFDRADVDRVTGLDNRDGIFPIHRGLRFVLMTCTAGRQTSTIRCRFGVSRVDELEQAEANDRSVTLTRALLTRLSGSDDLGVPELKSERDLRLVERISASCPSLGAEDGWHVHFGRELNASDDRDAFEPHVAASRGRPVVEGKQIEPFRVHLDRSRHQLTPGARDRVPRRARLSYRDVASATNRLTLIAAIVPARAVTTHTLFCLKTPLPLEAQLVLCGLLNSYVANYLIRLRVSTHVTASLMSRLPVPVLNGHDPSFGRIVSLVRELIDGGSATEDTEAYAELQAIVSRLYGLSAKDLEHVLSTFPLVPEQVRLRVLTRFDCLHPGRDAQTRPAYEGR